jgi:hypothetical protein
MEAALPKSMKEKRESPSCFHEQDSMFRKSVTMQGAVSNMEAIGNG